MVGFWRFFVVEMVHAPSHNARISYIRDGACTVSTTKGYRYCLGV